MHNARSELPRNLERRSSQNLPSETVWKIAEGIWSTLLWRQEAADRDSFDPSWPLRSPDSGPIATFQTVSLSRRGILARRRAHVMTSALLPLVDMLPEAAALGCSPRGRHRAAWFRPLPRPPRALRPPRQPPLFHNFLADAHLFLEDRALVHNDLFLGHRHHDLVVSDLGLRGLALYGHPLHADLLVAGGHLYALAVCSHALSNPCGSGLALAGARGELFFGSLHPELVLVLKVVASTLVYALIMGGVLAELAGFGVAHGHPGTHGASVGALI